MKKYCIVDRAYDGVVDDDLELEEGWIIKDGVVCKYVTEEEFKESIEFQIECVWDNEYRYEYDCEYSSIDELRSAVYGLLDWHDCVYSLNGFGYYIEED